MKLLATVFTLLHLVHFSAIAADFDTRDWFKGNTHTHSLWSDGNDFPEMIIAWYKEHGYDFIALSDHNVLQVGEKWMDLAAIKKRQRAIGRDAVSKCEAKFGPKWIQWETRGEAKGIQLKTLEQCRTTLEEPGTFYIMTAEEVSNSAVDKTPVHINALNTPVVIPAVNDVKASVADVMKRSLEMIQKTETKTGAPILAHLNHPNFRWAVTADDLAKVAIGGYVEIYNGHPGINHLGDADRPSDEQIWDIANTIRIAEMKTTPLMGVATDDSHTYHGGDVSPGRGWVVVGAKELNGNSIIEAMKAGAFYASSGVKLQRIRFNKETGALTVSIAPEEGITYQTQFIGTRRGYDASAAKMGIGEVFATIEGDSASFVIPGDALYLRATITSSRKHPNASFPEQKEQAWIQPVGWNLQ